MEVAEQDGGFCTRDHQYEEHDEQEPEHVIYLVGPGETRVLYINQYMFIYTCFVSKVALIVQNLLVVLLRSKSYLTRYC